MYYVLRWRRIWLPHTFIHHTNHANLGYFFFFTSSSLTVSLPSFFYPRLSFLLPPLSPSPLLQSSTLYSLFFVDLSVASSSIVFFSLPCSSTFLFFFSFPSFFNSFLYPFLRPSVSPHSTPPEPSFTLLNPFPCLFLFSSWFLLHLYYQYLLLLSFLCFSIFLHSLLHLTVLFPNLFLTLPLVPSLSFSPLLRTPFSPSIPHSSNLSPSTPISPPPLIPVQIPNISLFPIPSLPPFTV